MPKEIPQQTSENSNIQKMTLETPKQPEEFLEKEQENHFGIIPAFRILGEISKQLPKGYSLISAKFNTPIISLDNLEYTTEETENQIKVFVPLAEGVSIQSLEAIFRKNDNIEQETRDAVDENLNENIIADVNGIEKIISRKGDLVMINNVYSMNNGKTIFSREINDSDCEEVNEKGERKFNKFRIIEITGQAAEFYFLSEINKNLSEEEKKILTAIEFNMNTFPAVDDIKKGDELFIEIMQDEEEKKDNKARCEIYTKDGTIIARGNFIHSGPQERSFIEKSIKTVKRIKETE